MASNDKIDGIGGVSPRPPLGSGSVGPIGGPTPTGQSKPVDTKDRINLSDEVNDLGPEEPGQTAASQPTLGVPGVTNGGVISSNPTGGSGFPRGVHSGGVIVSGQSPGLNYLSGTAGKLYS